MTIMTIRIPTQLTFMILVLCCTMRIKVTSAQEQECIVNESGSCEPPLPSNHQEAVLSMNYTIDDTIDEPIMAEHEVHMIDYEDEYNVATHGAEVSEKYNCEAIFHEDESVCYSNTEFMFEHCPMVCIKGSSEMTQLGSLGYYETYIAPWDPKSEDDYDEDYEDDHYGDGANGEVSQTSNEEEDVPEEVKMMFCVDEHVGQEDDDSCEDFAAAGECLYNPDYMHLNCAKSCFICQEMGVETFYIGVPQTIPLEQHADMEAVQQVLNVILETEQYMSHTVMVDPDYERVRAMCQNTDELCAYHASLGYCHHPESNDFPFDLEDNSFEFYNYMMDNCAPSCLSCEYAIEAFESEVDEEVVKACTPDIETDIFQANDLNKMFERLIGEIPSDEALLSESVTVDVISRPSHPEDRPTDTDYFIGPWIVTLDDFITDEECERLKELGRLRGYDRSGLEEEEDEEGDLAYRTSFNTWCEEECFDDPIAQSVMERISHVTGIPTENSEFLQLLKYIPGQYYKEHHDYITNSDSIPPGPRMLTFFLYLNDVEEGGETRFNDISGDEDLGLLVDVKPKKGRALVWPSVLDEDPSQPEWRTYHEALTVLKGEKYGANAWLHLRDYKSDDCDYEAYQNYKRLNLLGDDAYDHAGGDDEEVEGPTIDVEEE